MKFCPTRKRKKMYESRVHELYIFIHYSTTNADSRMKAEVQNFWDNPITMLTERPRVRTAMKWPDFWLCNPDDRLLLAYALD